MYFFKLSAFYDTECKQPTAIGLSSMYEKDRSLVHYAARVRFYVYLNKLTITKGIQCHKCFNYSYRRLAGS